MGLTNIEWCTYTGNIWEGCNEVNSACDNCYAKILNHRWGKNNWGLDVPRRAVKSVWKNLIAWQKKASAEKKYERVFINSISDIFEKPIPFTDYDGKELAVDAADGSLIKTDALRDRFFNNISNNEYPNLIFLLLTKRISNAKRMMPQEWLLNPPKNVHIGVSIGDQAAANGARLHLQKLKSAGFSVFVSNEPYISKVNWAGFDFIDQLITGGESGNKKDIRPMHPDWVREARDFCKENNIAFFFKQWGEYLPFEATGRLPLWMQSNDKTEYDGSLLNFVDDETGGPGSFMNHKWMDSNDTIMFASEHNEKFCAFLRTGKHISGNLLDGKQHLEFAKVNI